MNWKKLKELKTKYKLRINNIKYKITDIKDSKEVKEFRLKDKKGQEYILVLVFPTKTYDFVRIEIDPLTNKPSFGEKDLIDIKSLKILKRD